MADPWDPFPFPLAGDPDEKDTYRGVGLVMSSWEAVEFEFARLYSLLVGDPDGPSVRDYGQPQIFRERLDGLSRRAISYFVRRCDQHLEGTFHRLTQEASGFSARRNEVAHGIVMDVTGISFIVNQFVFRNNSLKHYVVVPPYHLLRWHSGGSPNYALNFGQLQEIAARLLSLQSRIKEFRLSLGRCGAPATPR